MTEAKSPTTRSSFDWRWCADDDVPPRELMRRLTWDMERKIDAAFGRSVTNGQ